MRFRDIVAWFDHVEMETSCRPGPNWELEVPPETKQALNHEIPCWSSLDSVMGVKIVVNPSLARPRLRQIQQEWEMFEAPQFARNV